MADTADNGCIAVGIILGARESYQIGSMDNLMPEIVGTIESFCCCMNDMTCMYSTVVLYCRMELKRRSFSANVLL